MLRPIIASDNPDRIIPFLEYKIDFGGSNPSIPQQYMRINATGYANGFARTRTIYIPQLRTNSAFDFAVLQ